MTSQTNEDEIISQIFSRIGIKHKNFVEFGCGDGRQNNTIELLLAGWSGVWCEPHKRRVQSARERWSDYLGTNYGVKILRRRITPEKVNLIVCDPLDFLSIDIDGGDYEVWEACTARPRLLCIEAVEPRQWHIQAHRKDYRFITRSINGVNAFFVAGEAWPR